MEKYGTFYLFKNKKTGEIKKISQQDKNKYDELEKLAKNNDWVMVDEKGNEI